MLSLLVAPLKIPAQAGVSSEELSPSAQSQYLLLNDFPQVHLKGVSLV